MNEGFALTKFYRNFAIGFFSLSIVLLVFLVYLVWAKVTIFIIATGQKASHEFVLDVKETASLPSLQPPSSIVGKVRLIAVEVSQNFEATGEKPVESDIVGEVTIINNYSQNQTLVETTRLASPDDPDTVLVRLRKTIVVQPGEQIKVQVYPDNPEEFTDIAPRKFIIPGLWGPLQDKIYAESQETLTKAGQTVTVVNEEDFKQAEERLVNQMKEKAIADINSELSSEETLWPKLVSAESSEVSFNVEAGEEVAEFTATGKLQATVVVFNESQVMAIAREQFSGSLNQKSLDYSVEGYDLDQKTATIRVYVEGSDILSADSEILDKNALTGKTAQEIQEYFDQFSEVESVEVMFSPPWLKKTPRLKEKIEIKIE